MHTYQILRSVFSLASAITLLLLACMHFFPSTEVVADPAIRCNPSPVMALVRVLTWAWSDEGRTVISTTIGAGALLSFLCSLRTPEARELAVAIAMLLAFMLFAVMKAEAGVKQARCVQEKTALAMHQS